MLRRSLVPTRTTLVNHFDYRDGVLHAEDVALPEIAAERRHAVLLLFDGHADPALPRVRRGLCRARRAGLLRHEGQFQPGGAADAGQARRRRRRGLGRRAAPRAGRRHSGQQDPVLRRRQDRARDGLRARRPASSASTSNPSRSWSCCRPAPRRSARRRRSRCASIPDVDAKTHKKISTGKAENKFGIPWQRARAGLCPRGRAAGHQGHRHRHAYRQPDHRAAALRRRLRAAGRTGRHAARRRPCHRACRSRRRPRHSLPHRQRPAAPARRLCRRSSGSMSPSSA